MYFHANMQHIIRNVSNGDRNELKHLHFELIITLLDYKILEDGSVTKYRILRSNFRSLKNYARPVHALERFNILVHFKLTTRG